MNSLNIENPSEHEVTELLKEFTSVWGIDRETLRDPEAASKYCQGRMDEALTDEAAVICPSPHGPGTLLTTPGGVDIEYWQDTDGVWSLDFEYHRDSKTLHHALCVVRYKYASQHRALHAEAWARLAEASQDLWAD